MARIRKKLGEILKEWGVVTDKKINQALSVAKGQGKRIGEVLVELGFATDADVAKALAFQFEMEYIDLDKPDAVNRDDLELIPMDLIKQFTILPLGSNSGRMTVLIHDPLNLDLMDSLRFRLNCEVDTKLGSYTKIREFIDGMTSESQSSIDQALREMTLDARETSIDVGGLDGGSVYSVDHSIDQDATDGQEAPIVRLVNQIIVEAVKGRASDIHIEPFGNRVRLRYRIDGVCHEQDRIPKRTQAAVIARLKIMAGMKIEEKRVPQDGRIKLEIDGNVTDFRVSACPAYHGESIVLRILRPESARIGLENLGMRTDTLETFNSIIRKPNGIFLVTGPTGSGKTTTLYTALDVLNRPDLKIITAEDPIEYNFKGINQCQVHDQIGLTFSSILRAMLRQAPNIILVGEIRDLEVADVAIQAALTGHLVFSTLHTNDAPSALTRLVDMGVKPFLVASSIQAVLAQRLVRILCEHCKRPHEKPSQRLLRLCGLTPEMMSDRTIFEAVGCGQCGNTGYHGRRGIYELMIMSSEIRDLAFKRAPVNQLRAAASATGMRNLLGDGRLKVLDGETTLEELGRIAQVEGLIEGDDSDDETEAATMVEAT